jgi:hypothetical protein
MNLFEYLEKRDKRKTREMKGTIRTLSERMKVLEGFQAYQVQKDVLTATEDEGTYRGNDYQDVKAAVEEIDKKYKNESDWGCFQTGSIVDLRAAFIIQEGISILATTSQEDAKKEIEFAEKLLEFNFLDREMSQTYAVEGEIEGRILLYLNWIKEENNVAINFVSWQKKQYKVEANKQNYLQYEKVKWKEGDKVTTLKEAEFVYKKFGGRISIPNDAVPKIMRCLTQIEQLDKALRDWREINRLFSAPVPDLEVANKADVPKAQEGMDAINWKIKKGFAHVGTFGYKSPPIAGVSSLEDEIVMKAKMISGATGIPIQFLGLPDVLSNRATAENLLDLIYAATVKERETWKGVYQEGITKAMEMFNAQTGEEEKSTRLDPSKIDVDIPMVSDQDWQRLIDFWLPARVAGEISEQLFLSKIPNVNVDEETKRKIEEASKTDKDFMNRDNGNKSTGDEESEEEEENENAFS